MFKIFNHFASIVATTLVVFVFAFTAVALVPTSVQAQSCEYSGQCISNQRCFCIYGSCYLTNSPCGSAIVGGIEPPQGVAAYNEAAGGRIGLLIFISRLITLFSIVSGMLVMFNFISAGFIYIGSAGNTGAHEKVRDKITWGFVGLAVIAGAYTIAGIVGLLFFGDAGFVLNPTLQGALQ